MSTGASRLIRLGVPVTNTSATRSTSMATGWPAMASTRRSSRSVVGSAWTWGIWRRIVAGGVLSLRPLQSRLDDLVGHPRLLPGDEVVRRKGSAQSLLIDIVDQQ